MGGGGPAETGDHGGQIVAAVEAVLELGEVARDVLVADGVEGAGSGIPSFYAMAKVSVTTRDCCRISAYCSTRGRSLCSGMLGIRS